VGHHLLARECARGVLHGALLFREFEIHMTALPNLTA
jgi:hypothetical protein